METFKELTNDEIILESAKVSFDFKTAIKALMRLERHLSGKSLDKVYDMQDELRKIQRNIKG